MLHLVPKLWHLRSHLLIHRLHTVNPQYGMSLNYFVGQTPPPPFGQNKLVHAHRRMCCNRMLLPHQCQPPSKKSSIGLILILLNK
jgi:hypothetical protein